jgi:hypothetical protein
MKTSLIAATLATVDAAQYVKGKCGGDSKWHYDIWAPESKGSYPIMVYVTGGGGVAPGTSYSDLGELMANKGLVVTMLSRPAAPAPKKDAELEAKALDWLEESYSTLGLKATADFDKLVFSGHSAGNHVTCQFMTDSCGNKKAKGVVMMDPVDGYDPFGIVKNYCTTPGEKLSFDVPALLLRTGLDPKVKVMVACAPDKISNQRFFDAWSGPIWMANATKYGHLDVNNGGVGKMGSVMCAADNEPNDVYQEHIAELVDNFLKTIFDGDASAEAKLNDASWMKVDVELQKDYNGHSAPFKGGCTQKSVSV